MGVVGRRVSPGLRERAAISLQLIATWAAVEDELSRRAITAVQAEIEYPDAIGPGDEVELLANEDADGTLSMWLTAGGTVRASAQIRSVL